MAFCKGQQMNKQLRIAIPLVSSLLLSGCVIGNQYASNGENINITIGNIDVLEGEEAGHLDTVNGNIYIANKTRTKSAETVNGNIRVGEFSHTQDLETVNGNIELGKNVTTLGSIETVNGDIYLAKGCNVSKDLQTINGDITLKENAIVGGDIVFDSSRWQSTFNRDEPPVLTIHASAKVNGDIILRSPIELNLPADFDQSKILRKYSDDK